MLITDACTKTAKNVILGIQQSLKLVKIAKNLKNFTQNQYFHYLPLVREVKNM